MYAIVKYENEEIGAVMTNHSITTEEALNLIDLSGIDYELDYNQVEVEMVTDAEYKSTH